MQMQSATTKIKEGSSVKVEIACAECRDGKHGCAGIWEGLGLKIWCCCSCRLAASSVVANDTCEEVDDTHNE